MEKQPVGPVRGYNKFANLDVKSLCRLQKSYTFLVALHEKFANYYLQLTGRSFKLRTPRDKLHTCFLRQPSPLYFRSEAEENIKTSLFHGQNHEKTSLGKPEAQQNITLLRV